MPLTSSAQSSANSSSSATSVKVMPRSRIKEIQGTDVIPQFPFSQVIDKPSSKALASSLRAVVHVKSLSATKNPATGPAFVTPVQSTGASSLAIRDYLIGEKSAAISSFDSIFSSIGNAFGTKPSSQSGS